MDVLRNPGPHTCHSTDYQRITYTLDQLKLLKGEGKQRLPTTTYENLKTLGLLKKMRGCRAGGQAFRHIPVIVNARARRSMEIPATIHGRTFNRPRHLVHTTRACTVNHTSITPLPRILLTNARSLNNKLEDLQLVLSVNSVDIAAVTETWLNDITLQSANIPGFHCSAKCRDGRRGGGVAVYTKESFNAQILSNHSCQYECLWLKLNRNQSVSKFYIGVIYYPPGSTYANEMLEHIFQTVDDIQSSDTTATIILLGDFNDLQTDTIESNLHMEQLINLQRHLVMN